MSEKFITVDFEKFKKETGLDDDTVIELYKGFLEELLGEKDKLLTLLAENDYAKLSKTVHNIKGISSSYMAANVFERSLDLDMRLKAGKTDDIAHLVNKLVNDIIETAGEIIKYCNL